MRLNDYATSVYTNEVTTLTRTVNTLAPQQMVLLSSPATNNTIVPYSSNIVYLIQACFGTGLASAVSNFDLTINGSPAAAILLYHPSGETIPVAPA